MSKTTKRILLGVLLILGGMQFFRIDKTNPPAEPGKDFLGITQPPAELASLIRDACYDCHSHQTKYPWYSNVAPVSWFLKKHINEGRKKLNFSTWANYDADKQAHKLEEADEEVSKKNMPLKSYLPMHPEARLTDAQRTHLAKWFVSQKKVVENAAGIKEKGKEEKEEIKKKGEVE